MRSSAYLGPYWCPNGHGLSERPCERCNAATLHLEVSGMSEDWKPQRVRNLERELIHAEETLKTLDRDRDECRDRIANLKNQIEKETGPQQATVNWGGSTE